MDKILVRNNDRISLNLVPLIFIALFLFLPVSTILIRGFSFGRILGLLGNTYYRKIIYFTLLQAAVSTFFAMLIGLPGAYLTACYDFPGKKILRVLTTIPFVLPSILVVLGFVLVFGNNGFFNRILISIFNLKTPPLKILYNFNAIIMAHCFYNFPICIRITASVWEKISPSTIRAARNLGAKKGRVFFTVILPQILPGIAAAASLIFLFCFMSFSIILVLGGGPEFTTMEVEIYKLTKISLDLDKGCSLAVIQSVISFLLVFSYIYFERKTSLNKGAGFEKKNLINQFSVLAKLMAGIYFVFVVVIIITPLVFIVLRSFQARTGWSGKIGFSLKWYLSIIKNHKRFLSPILNSLFFAAATALFSVPLGTIIAYTGYRYKPESMKSRFFEAFLMMPMGFSSIILGLGYINLMHLLPFDINKRFLIVCVHVLIAYPFVIKSTGAVFSKIAPDINRAASSLGASRRRIFFTVELPLIKSGLISGAIFVSAISMGEFSATLLLAPNNLSTIPIVMYRLINSYNFFGACALGTILMLLCSAGFILFDKLDGLAE